MLRQGHALVVRFAPAQFDGWTPELAALIIDSDTMSERSAKIATEGEKFYELLAGENPAQGMINMFQDAASS